MIIYCTRELEGVIVCDVDKSMICTDKFLNVSKTYTWTVTSCWEEGKLLSCLIQTWTFVWNISVWRRTRFVPFIFSLHDQLLQYFYQFLTENIKFNSSWFPSTWWFPISFFFFSNVDQKKKMSAETQWFCGVFIMARIWLQNVQLQWVWWGLEKWTTH